MNRYFAGAPRDQPCGVVVAVAVEKNHGIAGLQAQHAQRVCGCLRGQFDPYIRAERSIDVETGNAHAIGELPTSRQSPKYERNLFPRMAYAAGTCPWVDNGSAKFGGKSMNKRILVIALATVLGACAISATAFAQQATDSQATTATAQPAAKAQKQRAVPPLDSRNCIRDTGSHIPPPKGQCLPVAGRSYSQQDIQRTGALTTGQALQMLDPSVTVRGH